MFTLHFLHFITLASTTFNLSVSVQLVDSRLRSTSQYLIMEARGKYDFNGQAEDELSFRKGDILKVRDRLL